MKRTPTLNQLAKGLHALLSEDDYFAKPWQNDGRVERISLEYHPQNLTTPKIVIDYKNKQYTLSIEDTTAERQKNETI